jgi:uncharacterized membrane protein YphA (DoxX/SURF4 family)
MFPTGRAGAALLLLRTLVAADLLVEGTGHWTLVTPSWICMVFVVPAVLLLTGVATPGAAFLSALIQFGFTYILKGLHGFPLVMSILSSAVVAILGPGAYSVDAYLFGRKLLKVPDRR